MAYFFAAELSISLLKSEGLAIFWLAGDVSTGVLIALGHDARLPVAGGTMVATIIASLIGDRRRLRALHPSLQSCLGLDPSDFEGQVARPRRTGLRRYGAGPE
jgi:hypothetical protein